MTVSALLNMLSLSIQIKDVADTRKKPIQACNLVNLNITTVTTVNGIEITTPAETADSVDLSDLRRRWHESAGAPTVQ